MSTATANPAASSFVVEASNSGGTGEMPSEGNHPAVLVGLVDLGTHDDEYQGKKITNRKVLFCWEIPGETRSDGGPFVLVADFNMPPTLSGKSKLRTMLEAWRGKPMEDKEKLDLAALLGKACLLNVGRGKSSKGSEFAKIMGISPMIRGMQAPRPFSDQFVWSPAAGPFNPPDWMPFLYGKPVVETIEQSREWRGGAAPAGNAAGGAAAEVSDDDIPF